MFLLKNLSCTLIKKRHERGNNYCLCSAKYNFKYGMVHVVNSTLTELLNFKRIFYCTQELYT